MTSIEDQSELALVREAQSVNVPIEMVRIQKNAAAAFTLACTASGLDDKEIYLALGIDAGYFSNIKKGKATLQADLIADFCKLVKNNVYPEWQAFQVGCTLVMIKTEAERRAEVAEKRAQEMEMKYRVLMETFHVRRDA